MEKYGQANKKKGIEKSIGFSIEWREHRKQQKWVFMFTVFHTFSVAVIIDVLKYKINGGRGGMREKEREEEQ